MSDSTVFGIELGLFIAEVGIIVTALSAIVGIWIERDREKPIRSPIALTAMILCCSGLALYQAWQNNEEDNQLQDELALVLEKLDEVAAKSEVEVPDLNETIKNEMMIHGRANPAVLMHLARRIAERGGDPMEVLAAYLPEADLQAFKRAGGFDGIVINADAKNASATKRSKLTFGSGPPRIRDENGDVQADNAAALTQAGLSDGGVAEGGAESAEAAGDAGTDASVDGSVDAGSDAGPATSTGALGEQETLALQIVNARRELAEAKTAADKQERQRKLLALLGAAEKLAKGKGATVPIPSTTKVKKPKIEIDEDQGE